MKIKLVTVGLLIQVFDTETKKFKSVSFDSRGDPEWTNESGKRLSEKKIEELDLDEDNYVVSLQIKEET